MRCVFLDFDGVINNSRFLTREDKKDPYIKDEIEMAVRIKEAVNIHSYTLGIALMDLRSIDPEKVQLVQKLIDRTGAKIVISSSWRQNQTLDSLRFLLKFHGLDPLSIIDMTPTNLKLPKGVSIPIRSYEIQMWLNKHPNVESFVILDDEGNMCHLKGYLVKTEFKEGLTMEHIEEATRKLFSLKSK